MDSVVYQDILDKNCIPFVEERFPDGYRLYQVHTGYTCICNIYIEINYQTQFFNHELEYAS